MSSIKQLRLKLIMGLNYENDVVYSEAYNLMNKNELRNLRSACMQNHFFEGFIIEQSSFEEGTYKEQEENEFQPLLSLLYAENVDEHNFRFRGQTFARMPYHVITKSILNPKDEILSIIASVNLNDINRIANYINEILENNNSKKYLTEVIKKMMKYK